MPSDNANKDDLSPRLDERVAGIPNPDEPPLTGVLTEEDVREIKASGITLGDVIREIEAQIASARE